MLDLYNEDKAKQGKRAPDGIRLSLLEENRVKRRKSVQGPKEKFTEDEELYLRQVLKEHSSGVKKALCTIPED